MGPPPLPSQSLSPTNVPAYLPVAGITDPKLRSIPPLDAFQVLEGGEQPVKSYQMRLRRPKYPWFILLLGMVFVAPPLMAMEMMRESQRQRFEAENEFERVRVEAERIRADDNPDHPATDAPPPRPNFEQAQEREPDPWWVVLIFCEIAVIAVVTAFFFVFRKRGHTFLYLTNRRLIVLELAQSLVTREQVVLNFNLQDISGFQLLAQRGLRKLLGILLLREKRTFYLSIATRTSCTVELGAVSTRGSAFEPGCDAVALCGELDAQVLALRAARAA
jgi:hypothetical protein